MDRHWIRALAVTALVLPTRAQTTERVSVDTNPDGASGYLRNSADGRYVTFESLASNLVPGDTNGFYDVFVRDTQSGTTERVSVGPGGAQANNHCQVPSISSDGRFVVWQSSATNLVASGTNGNQQIFLHDRQSNTTELVSLSTSGIQGNSQSTGPTVSADGRYVAYWSFASNLVAGDTNGAADVFVRDRVLGTTERVSLPSGGGEGNGGSGTCAISADGRYVAFHSDATNLVASDTNGVRDVFVRDRVGATTERVSVATGGGQGNGYTATPAISDDGRYVAFFSASSNLVAGDTNAVGDVFVRDRQLGTTEIASLSSASSIGNNLSDSPTISGDGRFVMFRSLASNLVAGDTNAHADCFVRDRTNGTTDRVSAGAGGAEGNADAGTSCSISTDGRYAAFWSNASNLVANDTNGAADIFVRDRQNGSTVRTSAGATSGNAQSGLPSAISADGRYVLFSSDASNLVAGDTNAARDVFVYDRLDASTERVSVSTGGGQLNDRSDFASMSGDGRYIAFMSAATNAVPGDTNGVLDVFVRDRLSGTTELVSVGMGGAQANGFSQQTAISSDGRYVAFSSSASNLVPGDTNAAGDIFVRDRQAGTTQRVSLGAGNVQLVDSTQFFGMSATGRWIAFAYESGDAVPGDTNNVYDVFVYDRQAGTTERVSLSSSGVQGNSDSTGTMSLSADGRYVAFLSAATNLVAGDTNGTTDVFVRDRQTGTTTLATLATSGAQANSFSSDALISAGGRFVTFTSNATNLVPNDVNGVPDVFVRDLWFGTTERVSVSTSGTPENSAGYSFAISPEGRYVAFESAASNLVDGDTNGVSDVFLRDRGAASSFVSFCFGDGTGAACPCANSGATGHGCENSSSTGGALLTATGVASIEDDTVQLTASGEKPTATSVVLQGTVVVNPIHYGDGLRCTGGSLKRLFTKNAAGGTVTIPQGAEPSLSALSAAKGDVIAGGSTRNYQIYYRDPSSTFCPSPSGSTFNITNAIAVAWSF